MKCVIAESASHRSERTERGACAILLCWVAHALACAGVVIPHPARNGDAMLADPRPATIAVLPFLDARTGDDADADTDAFVYQGTSFVGTNLGRAQYGGELAIAEFVGRELVAVGAFKKVVLVRHAQEAPEADFVLRGRIHRARGYVATQPEPAQGATSAAPPVATSTTTTLLTPASRRVRVVAEVVLADVEIVDAKVPERILLRTDLGFSIDESRAWPADPWSILGQALAVSVEQFVRLVKVGDLSGKTIVRDKVALTRFGSAPSEARPFADLESDAPTGWRFSLDDGFQTPVGWTVSSPRCMGGRLQDKSTRRVHRALGVYIPEIRLWRCARDVTLHFDAKAEWAAEYLGRHDDGAHYLFLQLGQSNWPSARADFVRYFQVQRPKERPVLTVKGLHE